MSDGIEGLRKRPGRASRIPLSNNGAGWKKRKTERLTLPSGQVVQVRRPGPEFMLRSGRAAQTFSNVMAQAAKDTAANGLSAHERGLKVIDAMSEDELAAYISFARALICAMLVEPKLVVSPPADSDTMGPDDLDSADFWHLFTYGMNGYMGIPVAVGSGDLATEVEVEDLTTFRNESSVSSGSPSGADVRADTEQSVGNSGLDNGEGTGHSSGEASE